MVCYDKVEHSSGTKIMVCYDKIEHSSGTESWFAMIK